MFAFPSFFRAGLVVLACLAVSGPARATGVIPELKISYSLATLSEARGRENTQADLWERIRAGFGLPESDPRLTRAHEQWYAKNPRHLERAIQRSRLYLFHIVEEVEKRGMPMEIALLPMIESAFNPQALSPMKASGIWQFIPSTGRIYGLEQNAWYDGRRDVLKATHAALDYLETLYRMFGDWELALAAYNCGEGCVARALGRGLGKDYANLRLPNETRNYVPKLVAVRNVIQDPARFGISLQPIADEAYFMQVTLDRPMTAQKAAKYAEMDINEFLALNPAFQRRVIYSDSHNTLLLPVNRVEAFQFNASRQEEHKRLQTYDARRGENAAAIAQRFGVSLDWLKEHNPIKLHGGKLTSAQTLVVPSAGKPASRMASAETTSSTAQPTRTPAKPVMRTHTVRKGDTLARVARHYNVKVADLRRWNENAEPLMPGSILEIPAQPS